MALPTNKTFRGRIDGKNAYTYIKQLDYKLNTYEERINLVNNILGDGKDDFFVDFFDNYYKIDISQDEYLSEENNICKSLEKIADYLLFSPDKKEKKHNVKYLFYTDDKMEQRLNKDKSLEGIVQNSSYEDGNSSYDEVIAFLVDKGQNYKKENNQKIFESDYKDKDLQEYFLDCRDAISHYRKLLKTKMSFKQRKTIMKLMTDIKYDMLIYKDKIKGTIYFKAVCNGSENPDWWLFNFTDEEDVSALLKCSRNDLSSDVGILNFDLNELLKQIKLSGFEEEILKLWRKDETSQESIAEILGVEQQFISTSIKKIVNKIIKQYEENYEHWVYKKYIKGQYKICSKCKKSKLVKYFYKKEDNKDGLHKTCKKCMKS